MNNVFSLVLFVMVNDALFPLGIANLGVFAELRDSTVSIEELRNLCR